MPPDRRTLRDIRQAYEGIKQQQLLQGEWMVWFRFNPQGTTSDPVYGTGPQRAWYPGVTVPVYIGEYRRASKNFDDDGLYLVDHVHGILSYDAFFHTAMPDPDPNAQDHLNDRVAYDGHLFSVASFTPDGRVASHFLTISFDLIEVGTEELREDTPISMFAPYLTAS